MAQTITRVLYAMTEKPGENHWKVKQLMRWKKEDLKNPYDSAVNLLREKLAA